MNWSMLVHNEEVIDKHVVCREMYIVWNISNGILPKGPYLPCVSMTGMALLAAYRRYVLFGYHVQIYI